MMDSVLLEPDSLLLSCDAISGRVDSSDGPDILSVCAGSESLGVSSCGPQDESLLKELLKEQEIKKARLARKAELARKNRKRRRDKLEELEKEVVRLKKELEMVEESKQLKRVSKLSQAKKIPDDLYLKLTSQEEDEKSRSVSQILALLKEQEDNRFAVIKEAKKVLEPTDDASALRFLVWLSTRPEAFFEDPLGLWNSLFAQHLQLDSKQLNNLKLEFQKPRDGSFPVSPANSEASGSSTSSRNAVQCALASLEVELRSEQEIRLRLLGSLQSVLSAEQLALFLTWARQNALCVRMLENIP